MTLIKENFASAYYNKGNALVQLDKYAEAIEVYKQTFEYEPPNADTYCAIGECYEKLEQMDEARSYYKKSVKMDSKMADAWGGSMGGLNVPSSSKTELARRNLAR